MMSKILHVARLAVMKIHGRVRVAVGEIVLVEEIGGQRDAPVVMIGMPFLPHVHGAMNQIGWDHPHGHVVLVMRQVVQIVTR